MLRGTAILAVLCYHGFTGKSPPESWDGLPRLIVRAAAYGATGVHLFFVLSGLLITGIILDGRDTARFMRRFYVRRALRILPAYLLMLTALRLSDAVTWKFVLACLLYIANMAGLLGARTSEYGSLWSLAVEEQFYLVWPWIARKFTLRTLMRIMSTVCVATALLRCGLAYGAPASDHYYKTWVNADYLLYGGMVATACRAGSLHAGNVRWLRKSLLFAGIVGIAAVIELTRVRLPRLEGAALSGCELLPFIALYVGLLLLILERHQRSLRHGLLARGLMFLGYISYGLYLVHSFVYTLYDRAAENLGIAAVPPHFAYQLLRALVGAGLSILLAYLSRRYFESRFLRVKSL